MPEYSLFERIKNGDNSAFEGLFRKHYEGVYHFIWGYVQSNGVAEELTQDTFLKIWEQRASIRIERSFKAYLFQVARNKSLDWLKHKKIERKWEEEKKQNPLRTHDVSERLHQKWMLEEIKKAILELPERRREVFMLSRYEGMTYKEIADTLDITVSTVETHIGLALETLRTKFLPFLSLLSCALLI